MSEHTLSGVHQRWFRRERGILGATLKEFGVYSVGDEVAFAYPGFYKTRGGIPDGERTFRLHKHPKMKLDLYGLDQLPEAPHTMILCEGETDTMRLWQELAEHGVEGFGVVGLPGVHSWQTHMAEHFDRAKTVYVIFDNDEYSSPAFKATHQAWRKIRAMVGPKARRVSLTEAGCKDVCEFFQGFSLEDMGSLFRREPDWHFAALNLHDLHLPRETTWFIDGILAVNDTGMLTGDSGVGKSMLALDLTVAAIMGRPWCGQAVRSFGAKVLYIDEENPENLVVQRAHRLGMTDTMAQNVRYLCQQGINLERDLDELIEDAQRFDPDLIVLDTLIQLHDGDEIDAKAMTRLFAKAIRPLARECQATVLALHHVNKPRADGTGNPSTRIRGSTAIKNSVDSAVEARESDAKIAKHIVLEQFKNRRSIPVRPIKVTIGDLPDGRLEVAAL
jgi:hypothetical protein